MSASGAAMTVAYWTRQLTIGGWMVGGAASIVVLYAVAAQRPAVTALIATAVASVVVTVAAIRLLPIPRMLVSRWCPAVFSSVSALTLAAITAVLVIDQRGGGPLALLDVAVIACASATYPPRMALAVCAATVLAVAGAATSVGGADPATAVVLLTMLLLSVGGVALSHRQFVAAGQLQRLMRQVEQAAAFDGLTGCMNGSAFRSSVAHLTDTADVTIAMVDLDGFKAVNDTQATTPATVCSARSAGRCARPSGRSIWWAGWAVTSSR